MNLYLPITFLTVAVLSWSGSTLGQAISDNKMDIKANQAIQAKLDKLMAGIRRNDTEEQVDKKLNDIMQDLRAAISDEDLLVQIVLHQSAVKDEHVMWMDELLLFKLVEKMNRYEIMKTTAPLLNNKNKKVRRKLYEIMDGCCQGRPTIDFNRVFSMMRAEGTIPDALVEYMYDRSPDKAMLGYMRYNNIERLDPERRNLLLAEREISNTLWKQRFGLLVLHEAKAGAIAELEKLSRHKEWWARLYVAAIMRQHQGFRRPDIIERLKTDAHPLVRKAMRFADENAKGEVR